MPCYIFSHFPSLLFISHAPSFVHLCLFQNKQSMSTLFLLIDIKPVISDSYLANLHLGWYSWYNYLGMVAFQTTSWKAHSSLPVISGVWPCLIQPALSHIQDTAALPGTCCNFHQCILLLFVMFSNFLMSCPIFFCVLISVVSLKPEPTQGSHHYLPAALRMSFSAYLEAQIQTALECVNTFLGLPWETTKMYVEKLCLFFLSRMKRSWDTFVNFINK